MRTLGSTDVNPQPMWTLGIALLYWGSGNVGKTSVIQRFLTGNFQEKYVQTVEDLHCKEYNIFGNVLKVDILDTAGNLAFPAMRRLSISTAHAFLLVYSVNCQETFEEVKRIREQIKEQRANYQDLPCVVVGNKNDLESAREVARDDVQTWAYDEGIVTSVLECSSKNNTGVLEVFQKLMEIADVPQTRGLDPALKRRLSAKVIHRNTEKKNDDTKSKGFTRSRSLIRRSSKPKVKQTGDPTTSDCHIS